MMLDTFDDVRTIQKELKAKVEEVREPDCQSDLADEYSHDESSDHDRKPENCF